jgi:D-3-phosphoglycerate dehydrogenase
MKPKVVVTYPLDSAGLELLEASCECLKPWQGNLPDEPRIRALLPEVDAMVIGNMIIGAEDFARAGRLKVVARPGVGYDNIDCVSATQHGIAVVYTPGANATAVAEHALMLLLATAKNARKGHETVVDGRFPERRLLPSRQLEGKTLGIIGLGNIGSRVAAKAAAGFDMEVLGYDPPLGRENYSGVATFTEDLDGLLGAADFLTFHVPLTDDTRHMVNASLLSRVKPDCILINTSRGGVVDEKALAAALDDGRLAAAGLDVFEVEPVPAGHPLGNYPNVVLSPHTAAFTPESVGAMSRGAAEGIVAVLRGERPAHVVNPEVFGG